MGYINFADKGGSEEENAGNEQQPLMRDTDIYQQIWRKDDIEDQGRKRTWIRRAKDGGKARAKKCKMKILRT